MKKDEFRVGVLPHVCTGQAKIGKNWIYWHGKVRVMDQKLAFKFIGKEIQKEDLRGMKTFLNI